MSMMLSPSLLFFKLIPLVGAWIRVAYAADRYSNEMLDNAQFAETAVNGRGLPF